jgi:hypothetical protein
MRFITEEDARRWAVRFARENSERGLPVVPAPEHKGELRYVFEDVGDHSYFALAQAVIRSLEYFDECLLWVTQTGVWPSNENLQLYYRFRQSYGDQSLVHEKPAALLLRHEAVDLTTLVHLGMLFGWDMYLVTSHDYGRVFISHDGWIQFSEVTPQVTTELLAQEKGRDSAA